MPDRRISRLVSGSAAALTAAALVLPPSLYVSLTHQRLAGNLEAEAELDALGIGRIIAVNPDLWEYEDVRLREFLEGRRRGHDDERRRIVNLAGEVVAESADPPLPRPVITRSWPLRDAGAVVGAIEISRSLRPVLVRASLLALVLLPIAGLAFQLLRVVPLRAIRGSEEALRRERDTVQRYLDVAGVAFVILDGAGRVRLVNRRGAEILGRCEGELVGRDWIESFVDEADRGRVAARLSSPARPGEVFELEYALVRPGGERRTLSWYVTPLDDGAGPSGLLASGVDITTQRRLEAQLGHHDRLEALSEMASGVAHDFNNVLTVIQGYAQMLRRDELEEHARSHVDEIVAAADRASALTGSLLTFSRRKDVHLEPVDLLELVDRVQRLLRHLVRKGIELRIEATGGPLPVLGDCAQLEQVLMNLVTNARDALPQGGAITVAVSPVRLDDEQAQEAGLDGPGEYARVSVADDGVGMDRETQARVFEPFFTTKEPGKGTGLGLAIAYGVVKKHGGAIGVTSEPGRGTTFTFYIPLRAAAPLREAEPAEAGAA